MQKPKDKVEGFDRVFPLIGGSNFYQWFLLGITAIQSCVLSFHHMGYMFLGGVPGHWCEVEELQHTNWTTDEIKNISIPKIINGDNFERCEYYDLEYTQFVSAQTFADAYASINFTASGRKACTEWTYDKSIYLSTTVSQFNLVCERQYLVATIQATYMAGVFLSGFIFGGLSDRVLGRRNTVLCSVCLVIVFGFAASFSTSYSTFIICRFFIAAGVAGSYQNCFTLLMEYCDARYRAIMGILTWIPFAIGYMLIPVYAYFFRDWVHLQLAFSITTLILLSYFWILPESSRWLTSKGREAEALKILQRIAKINKKPKPHHLELMVILEACKQENSAKLTAALELEKLSCPIRTCVNIRDFLKSYLNLVKTPELRKRSIILWILFISVTLVYYGVSFDSALLTNDPFLIVFLGGLIEIPGYVGVTPFTARWGRRPTVATTFLLSGIALFLVASTPFEYKVLRVIFSMSGKLFISGCFGVIYLLGTELYPTAARATGLGSATIMGRFGSILAPYVVTEMKGVYPDLPSVIFGVTGIFAGVIAFLLPETKNEEMRESVNAIETHSHTTIPTTVIELTRRFSQPRKSVAEISPENK